MATIKSYSDLQQSKVLAKILPLESADMTLPFRHPKNDEYIPGYVVSRNYVEVYNEMMKLPAMEKEDVCKLIQPSWSLAALLNVIPKHIDEFNVLRIDISTNDFAMWYDEIGFGVNNDLPDITRESAVDACVVMIEKLHELNLL